MFLYYHLLLCCLALVVSSNGVEVTPEFLGGSMSYAIERSPNGKTTVNVDMITAWVMGTGPCGMNCSRKDIGKRTELSHSPTLQSPTVNRTHLGTFSLEITDTDRNDTRTLKIINAIVEKNGKSDVLAVSEDQKWEMERMRFSVEIPNDTYSKDISFAGYRWHDMSMKQSSGINWYMQFKSYEERIRSDTNTPNRPPEFLTRPYYRIAAGSNHSILLAYVDQDNDVTSCSQAAFVELGGLPVDPRVTIHKDCTINIDASVYEPNNMWLAIAVTVRDRNVYKMSVASELHYPDYPQCAVPLQLMIHIETSVITPEFVRPTLEATHKFIVYAGAAWRTVVYAMSSDSNVTEFTVTGRHGEQVNVSAISTESNVASAELTWDPPAYENYSHIFCVTATNAIGVDSAEFRCFIVETIDRSFSTVTPSPPTLNRPYFVGIPSPSDVIKCEIGVTCIFPLYINSNSNITVSNTTELPFEYTRISPPFKVVHRGESLYKVDVEFLNFKPIVSNASFIVATGKEKSDTASIQVTIYPKDPCRSFPCKNSGICVSDENGGFVCQCPVHFNGTFCEEKIDYCRLLSPCFHGVCFSIHLPYFCYCTDNINQQLPNDYTGVNCSEKIDDCLNPVTPCNDRQVCVDGMGNNTCECMERYSGNNCEIDNCPHSLNKATCPIDDHCDFENGVGCSWQNVNSSDDNDWYINQGRTPSPDTGPEHDHTLGTASGTYMFIETSAPTKMNHVSWLQSGVLQGGVTRCLQFWYNMYGEDTGILSVYISSLSDTLPGTRVWTLAGNQGQAWKFGQVEVSSVASSFWVIIEGTVGDGYKGDIAVDDISISGGRCQTIPSNGGNGWQAVRGSLCFQCKNITDMSHCRTVAACPSNEICSIEEHGNLLSGMCVPRNLNRDLIPGTCQQCCSDDYCNYKCQQQQQQQHQQQPGLVG